MAISSVSMSNFKAFIRRKGAKSCRNHAAKNGVVFERGSKCLNFSFVTPKQAHHCTELHLLTILHQNPYRYLSYVNKSMHEVMKRYLLPAVDKILQGGITYHRNNNLCKFLAIMNGVFGW